MKTYLKISPQAFIAFLTALYCLWIVATPSAWHTPFQQTNNNYLEHSKRYTIACLASVGVIKGGLDIIEGSTLGIDAGVKSDIEFGDIAQPVLDIIGVIWKVMLTTAAYVTLLLILTQVTPFLSVMLSSAYLILFLCVLLWNAVGKSRASLPTLPSITRPMRFLCVLVFCLQILIPMTIRLNAFISDHALVSLRKEQYSEINSIRDGYAMLTRRLQYNKSALLTSDFWGDSWILLQKSSTQLPRYAISAIAISCVEGILIPLFSLICLIWFARAYIFPFLDIPFPELGKKNKDQKALPPAPESLQQ